MKRFCSLFLLLLILILHGCAVNNFADITPAPDAIESICFQRTNIDKKNQYTYFEKTLTEPEDIKNFCNKLDKVKVIGIDPIKFSSVDYLIIFEGPRQHKLLVCQNEIIYDGIAYKINSGSLNDAISHIYNKLPQQEQPATSKLFK